MRGTSGVIKRGVVRMTDAATPLDGLGLDRYSTDARTRTGLHTLDGSPGNQGLSSRTIAEAVRTAANLPAPDGARLLMELTLAGGPWDSAAIARRLPRGRWGTWAGTGPLGQMCDQAQWELGEGPACDALKADLVSAADLSAEQRWPAWRATAEPLGGRAAVAARLHARRTLGTLTLYADRPVMPGRAGVEHLHTMAAHLSVLLGAADRLHHLDEAMRNRGTIGQAIGLLVERYGIAPDQAFGTLRRISQNENVKIAYLATVLLETGELPGLYRRGD